MANDLHFSEKVKRKALEVIREAELKNISVGKDPTGMAASVLYIASQNTNEHKTQARIARMIGVTEVTVRNRSKEIRKQLEKSDAR
jgi:transcription initiation factor TFIIB